MPLLKRLVVGRPLPTQAQDHERLPKLLALPTFSSDAVSSTAYATEQILFVTAVGGSSLALGLAKLVPISVVVAVLLAVVVVSYRQTIFAYPNGGGSYIVSRDNLGRYPSLVAAASLLIDYVLTVAVSIAAGVAAIVSLPALGNLARWRVPIAVGLVVIMTLVNLRGMRTPGALFAAPFYGYVVLLVALVVTGLARAWFGHLPHVPFDTTDFAGRRVAGGTLGLLLLLRGFSSGAVALTGVEAISNGVPAFRRPESRNAATTMAWMGVILGALFFGVSVLAHHAHPYPSDRETVLSQLGRVVFGTGPVYLLLQVATAAILTLAANTSYADFPRLCSILARDGFLPRRFAHRGDRLVFSNGIIVLSIASSLLLVVFGGTTTALIPLYAVGVFTAFTLSQFGMVEHHRGRRERGWRRGMAINAAGGVTTLLVLVVIAATKFTEGAWIPVVVVPLMVVGFLAVRSHHDALAQDLAIDGERPSVRRHDVVVLVARVDRAALAGIQYARSLCADSVVGLHVVLDDADEDAAVEQWRRLGAGAPLVVVRSPYRELIGPIERWLEEQHRCHPERLRTVVICELARQGWADELLHTHGRELREHLLDRTDVIVASMRYRRQRREARDNEPTRVASMRRSTEDVEAHGTQPDW